MRPSWHTYIRSGDEKPRITRNLLKRVLAYAGAYRWHLVGMLVLILGTSGLSLLSPLIVRDLIDKTLPNKDTHRLLLLSLALLALPALQGAMRVLERRLNTAVGEGIIFDLRSALFAKFQQMPLSFFTHTKVGEMMSRLNNDVIGAQTAISNTIVNILTDLVQAVAVISVMATIEWRLTLISVIILPLFILAARLLGGRLRDAAREQMEANSGMNALINETLNIGGALLVKLFGQQQVENDHFRERASRVRDMGIKRAVYGSFFFVIISLLSAVGTALVYGFGGYQVILDRLTVGTIVALGSYLGMLYASLQSLSNAPVEFSTSVVSFERVFEVLDLPVEIEEKEEAVQLKKTRGEIRFDHVWFEYNDNPQDLLSEVKRFGSDSDARAGIANEEVPEIDMDKEHPASQARKTALLDIDFTIPSGQLTALVGPSGAGKTTITYLIPRLYDPTRGRILIDGHNLRDVTLSSLSDQIGMVTQETNLFHDSIYANLLFARPDATQAEIIAAAKAANIHNFISDLPEQYKTVVGERGYRLSGGEKQRIALARVILKDPRILILDEATSNLDSESEALIQEALKRVMAGRTSLVIAHRLSTILAADQILVLNRGKIAEKGTHQELLALDGIYAHLYHTQFQ
ncbi:MAG: ATP-binding cassette, subfamily bacterial [Chloroflexota bacterium]|nr:ATP-binding cassette, subfamily bacterial [Chloroflexota bacterium]